MDATDPVLARQYAHRALRPLVMTGAFVLADRYRGDPLRSLDECNAMARTMPLFPAGRAAPRLAATLTSLVGDVDIGSAVLEGMGNPEAARALRAALLDGIDDPSLRAWAQRELAHHGTITGELVAHQMAQEEAGKGMRPGDAAPR